MHHDEDEDFEEGDDAEFFREDPQAAEKAKEAKHERMVAYVKKHAMLEDDEIQSLYPDDTALEAFCEDLRKMHSLEDDSYLDEDEKDDAPEDKSELTPEDADYAARLAEREGKSAKRAKKRQSSAEKAAEEDFHAAGNHLAEEDKPAAGDYAAMKKLLENLPED